MIQSIHGGITVTITDSSTEHTTSPEAIFSTEAAIRLLIEDLLNYNDHNGPLVSRTLVNLATYCLTTRQVAEDI